LTRLVGEPHAAALPLEEHGPGLPFQLGDLLGDGGRCEAERGGGRPDGAVHGDGVQGAQALQVEHVGSRT
jgi:hypothetical protein